MTDSAILNLQGVMVKYIGLKPFHILLVIISLLILMRQFLVPHKHPNRQHQLHQLHQQSSRQQNPLLLQFQICQKSPSRFHNPLNLPQNHQQVLVQLQSPLHQLFRHHQQVWHLHIKMYLLQPFHPHQRPQLVHLVL
eukprot:NODE_1137_length_2056_cov_0.948901.p3 type:complete len:137 gc:universal NODE_1137_length_2056_cov_0.948901:830-420(-)